MHNMIVMIIFEFLIEFFFIILLVFSLLKLKLKKDEE